MPTAPRAPAAAPPTRVERLPPGQQRLLWLDEGTELRCLHGILRLRPAWVARGELPLLGDRELPASRAWRSDQGQWLQVAALQPSLYRLEAASLPVRGPMFAARQAKENHPEPRGTGWLMETAAGGLRRMAAALRRGRRAA